MKKSPRTSRKYTKRASSGPKVSILLILLLAIPITIGMVYTRTQLKSNADTTVSAIPAPERLAGKPEYIPGKLVVGYKETVVTNIPQKEQVVVERLSRRNARRNIRVEKRLEQIRASAISVAPSEEAAVVAELESDPDVAYVEPDYLVYATQTTPNDFFFTRQYALHNTGQEIPVFFSGTPTIFTGTPDADMDIPEAWEKTRGLMPDGQPVKVAVLDSGIDTNHPDLSGKVVLERNFTNTDSTDDFFGHGTHIAGSIVAKTNNTTGIAGVCPDCVLLNGKVLNDTKGEGPNSGIAAAIIWAVDNGARVINLSLGTPKRSDVLINAVNYAANKNVVVVAAAGNENSQKPFYPAANGPAIAVAAVDYNDQRTDYSNFGTWIEIAAHGQIILSTMPTHPMSDVKNPDKPQNYAYLNGTSMATPHVSGIAALVWTTEFGTSANAVRSRLLSTADQITGTGQLWSNGRVNAQNAVGLLSNQTITPVPNSQNFSISGEVFIDANKNDKRSKKERGFAGIRVTLTGPVSRNAVTVNGGRYTFENLEPGIYTVSIHVPNKYRKTTAGTVSVTLNGTTSQKSVHFGIIKKK